MEEKCKKCFWYFSIRDHRGKVWGRACYHAIDGLLDGQDIKPTEDCFEARKRRREPEMEMKDFRELLKDFVRLSEGRDKEPNSESIKRNI